MNQVNQSKPAITISWETAEYLAILMGQTLWGNRKRRRDAIQELSQAMGTEPLETSKECF